MLGINRVADFASRVDASFSLDRVFLNRHAHRLAHWILRGDEVFAGVGPEWPRTEALVSGVTYLERRSGSGLTTRPWEVRNGLSSGYGALNVAVLKGAREIFLLGFDMVPPARKTDMTRWHDGYSWDTGSTRIYWGRWAARFNSIPAELPRGVSVVNVNPKSAIRAFPFATYDELEL